MSEQLSDATQKCVRLVGENQICGSVRRVQEAIPLDRGERVIVRCADCGAKRDEYERGKGERRARGLRAQRETEMAQLGMNMREWSLYKAREWTDRYGTPPASLEWNLRGGRTKFRGARLASFEQRHREAVWPSTTTILSLFGSWNTFIEEAGLETVAPGQRRKRGATTPAAAPQSA